MSDLTQAWVYGIVSAASTALLIRVMWWAGMNWGEEAQAETAPAYVPFWGR